MSLNAVLVETGMMPLPRALPMMKMSGSIVFRLQANILPVRANWSELRQP